MFIVVGLLVVRGPRSRTGEVSGKFAGDFDLLAYSFHQRGVELIVEAGCRRSAEQVDGLRGPAVEDECTVRVRSNPTTRARSTATGHADECRPAGTGCDRVG